MIKNLKTYYVTKYALTQGILEVRAYVTETSENMIAVEKKANEFQSYFHKPDWHETLFDAQNKAHEMKTKKIEHLEKALRKIKALKFYS